MRTCSLELLAKQDFSVQNIVAVCQSWTNGTCYRHIDAPRRNSGLVIFATDGIVYTFPDGHTVRPNAGDIMVLPIGTQYNVICLAPKAESFLLQFRMTDRQGEELCFSKELMLLSSRNDLLPLFADLCGIYRTADSELLLRAQLYLLLHRLHRSAQTVQSAIAPALDYIRLHLTEVTSVGELARRCAMNECTFRRIFRKETGHSPIQFIISEKLQKAQQMLSESDVPVGDIVSALGFCDASYFNKCFHARFGVSPTQYRTKIKQ